jgi:hypothetical protein
MKQYLKNSFIILLLVAIMAPLSFAFMSYRFQLKLIKREVKQQLIQETNRTDLVALSFDIYSPEFKGLRWEHDREFEFNEKMYDIVDADTSGHIIHFLCFPDKQETALNQLFNKKLEDRYANDQPAKNRANQMLALIYGLYFLEIEIDDQNYTNYITQQYACYEQNYQTVSLELPSPPPKFFI